MAAKGRTIKISFMGTVAALYARVSTDDKGQDTENQLVKLRNYAKTQGWEIIEYAENESAALGKAHRRPAFQSLMNDAMRRRFDLVLFWSLDRFTREGAQPTLQLLNKLAVYGVRWQSFTEQYLSSLGVWGDAIVAILATIARQETIRQSERVKAGLARRKAKGLKLGRPQHDVDWLRVRHFFHCGYSIGAISKALGYTKSSAYNYVRQIQVALATVPAVRGEVPMAIGCYAIQGERSGIVKIGRAVNLRTRIVKHSEDLDEPVNILGIELTEKEDRVDMEGKLLAQCVSGKLPWGREWYEPTPQVLRVCGALGIRGEREPLKEFRPWLLKRELFYVYANHTAEIEDPLVAGRRDAMADRVAGRASSSRLISDEHRQRHAAHNDRPDDKRVHSSGGSSEVDPGGAGGEVAGR